MTHREIARDNDHNDHCNAHVQAQVSRRHFGVTAGPPTAVTSHAKRGLAETNTSATNGALAADIDLRDFNPEYKIYRSTPPLRISASK